MTYDVVVVDSLEKVHGPGRPRSHATGALSALRGETVSFQIAVRPPQGWSAAHEPGLAVAVDTPAGVRAEVFTVELVPCAITALERHDQHYDHTGPALLADLLKPMSSRGWQLAPRQWRAVWITLTVDKAAPAGNGQIGVQLRDGQSGELIATPTLALTVIAATLPELPIINTHWLHVDSIAQYYALDPYSDRCWQAIENYLLLARRMDVNSVLTPVHTPPLDTENRARRMNVQLVDVYPTDNGYDFRFDKLSRWIDICRRAEMTHLEMAHLFSQWGAESCPAIYAADGTQLFGWDDEATSPRYLSFLAEYIPALRQFLDQHWGPNVIWHLSDEPHGPQARQRYARLKELAGPLLADAVVVDALSDLEFYAEGHVPVPVVATDAVQPFLAAGVSPLWVYYCTAQSVNVANRFIGQPSYRNRVLGLQLFAFDCAAFLHWGFNFYNSGLSRRPIDPFADTTAGGFYQAGDPFVVYPGPDLTPWSSVRFWVFAEAMADLRALTLLAERIGAAATKKLIDPASTLTFADYSHDPSHYLRLRAKINTAIAETC